MHALVVVILMALDLYTWVIIGVAILSWLLAFNIINYHNNLVRSIWNGLNAMTEPVLRPIRRIVPAMGGLDISPILLLLLVHFVRQLIQDNLLYVSF